MMEVQNLFFYLALAVLAGLLALLLLRYRALQSKIPDLVQQRALELNRFWQEQQLDTLQGQLRQTALEHAAVQLAQWKQEQETIIRRDAILRSQAVITGKTTEHLVPYLPDFDFNPRDARFIGSPVDLIVFDGLQRGELERIVFVEIKTGKSNLSFRERQVRNAVLDGMVDWREIRIHSIS